MIGVEEKAGSEREYTRLLSILRPAKYSRSRAGFITLLNLLAFFTVWELVALYSGLPTLVLPRFASVLAALPEMHAEGILVPNLMISLKNFAVGLSIAIFAGVPLGLVIGSVKVLDRLIGPYVWVLYTLPRLVLMPIVLVIFGLGTTTRVVLVILGAIPAILVFVMEGAKGADMSLVRASKAFCAKRRDVLVNVVLPGTLPFVASGIRLGVARGLLGLFVGELFTAGNGIGYLLLLSSRTFATDRTYLILLMFIGFSVSLVAMSNALERKVSRWQV